jgi:hypothetical protein
MVQDDSARHQTSIMKAFPKLSCMSDQILVTLTAKLESFKIADGIR